MPAQTTAAGAALGLTRYLHQELLCPKCIHITMHDACWPSCHTCLVSTTWPTGPPHQRWYIAPLLRVVAIVQGDHGSNHHWHTIHFCYLEQLTAHHITCAQAKQAALRQMVACQLAQSCTRHLAALSHGACAVSVAAVPRETRRPPCSWWIRKYRSMKELGSSISL